MAASRRSTRAVAMPFLPGVFARQDDPGRGRRQPPVAAPREQAHAGGRSRSGSGTMRVRAILLAAALVLAPIATRAADLVVWWDEGFHPEEDQAVREIVAAFEHETGRRVELVLPSQDELTTKTLD